MSAPVHLIVALDVVAVTKKLSSRMIAYIQIPNGKSTAPRNALPTHTTAQNKRSAYAHGCNRIHSLATAVGPAPLCLATHAHPTQDGNSTLFRRTVCLLGRKCNTTLRARSASGVREPTSQVHMFRLPAKPINRGRTLHLGLSCASQCCRTVVPTCLLVLPPP